VVKYRKIPATAAANQIAENARILPAADLQKGIKYFMRKGLTRLRCIHATLEYFLTNPPQFAPPSYNVIRIEELSIIT
jgi:hypothetical protein